MGSLFSRKKEKPSRVTEQDKAVLELKGQRDNLKQYQRRIEKNMERERNVAKELVKSGKKEKALLLLKKKRFQETLIQRISNQLDQIEKMTSDVEFAQIEIKVMEGLKAGNESLKQMHRLMSVEDVEKILDETREAVEYQNEIDSLISGQLTDNDMNDVEEELEFILQQEKEEQQMKENVIPQLPEVPDDQLPVPTPAKKEKKEPEAELVPA